MDFRDAVFETIHAIMRRDAHVMVVTNDMGAMLLDAIRREFPERVVNLGIAEQNLMSVCGGLAQSGKRVFAFGIAAHVIARGLEQIKLDICAPGLPVVIVGVGPGLAYGNDGPTHHGTEDVAFMRALPNMTIFNPCDAVATRASVELAYAGGGPGYIRLDKEQLVPLHAEGADLSAGVTTLATGVTMLSAEADVTLFATGVLVHRAVEVARHLAGEGLGVEVIDVLRLKPLNETVILEALGRARRVATLEEHSPVGGLGSAVADLMARNAVPARLHVLSLPDRFLLGSASRPWAHRTYGLDVEGLTDTLRALARPQVN
jgi:transketolase